MTPTTPSIKLKTGGGILCSKCGRTKKEEAFYKLRSGERADMCKQCLTLHVDNFDPNTFLWLLEKFDIPYIEVQWNVLRDREYAKNPLKMNGMTVFGKYLSKMKLKQWMPYHWSDSEELNERNKAADTRSKEQVDAYREQLKQQLESGQISEAQYITRLPAQILVQQNGYMPVQISGNQPTTSTSSYVITPKSPMNALNPNGNNPFMQSNYIKADLPDPAADLTPEDIKYLAMKWGTDYQPRQWIQLQKKYTEMMASFDIRDSDTIGSLILICKTYLKMNEAINMGDLEGFQKLSRVYDMLRKSAKFTAVQIKQQKHDAVDSVGQIVAFCQKHGGVIPRHEIIYDYDIIDKVINDMKRFNRSLIEKDSALNRQIEEYIKRREISDQMKRDRQAALAKGEEEYQITDEDYEEHLQLVKFRTDLDKEIYNQEGNS